MAEQDRRALTHQARFPANGRLVKPDVAAIGRKIFGIRERLCVRIIDDRIDSQVSIGDPGRINVNMTK